MTVRKWNRVTIVGCGLIGASFALALKRRGACLNIAGWDASSSALNEALRHGVIDEVDQSFISGEVSHADLIYLAMPVKEILNFLQKCGQQLKLGAVVTDAGSTKVAVCGAARESLPENRHFIGGHPIAGSHHTGISHARADLFDGAPYALTIDNNADTEAFTAVKVTIESLGARVALVTAAEHDRAMALVSHLPQILASTLAATIEGQPNAEALLDVSGSGYRDMTRLAASSWFIWQDILATNRVPIIAAMDALIEKLLVVRGELQDYSVSNTGDFELTSMLFHKPDQTDDS